MLVRGGIRGGKLLSPRIKVLWYLEIFPLLLGFILLVYLLFYELLPSLGFHNLHSDIIFIFSIFLTGVAGFAGVELRFRTWVYALDEEEFIIKKGIFEKIRYLVPYEKIQNVTVSRSPFELVLGIGTIHIETAATMLAHSDFSLPGIENYHDIVNQLIEHSQTAQQKLSLDISHHEQMILELQTLCQTLEKISDLLETQNRKSEPVKEKVEKSADSSFELVFPLTDQKKKGDSYG